MHTVVNAPRGLHHVGNGILDCVFVRYVNLKCLGSEIRIRGSSRDFNDRLLCSLMIDIGNGDAAGTQLCEE